MNWIAFFAFALVVLTLVKRKQEEKQARPPRDIWEQVDRTFEEVDKVFKMVPEGETKMRKGNRFLRVFKKTI